jgi:hypothetical protein
MNTNTNLTQYKYSSEEIELKRQEFNFYKSYRTVLDYLTEEDVIESNKEFIKVNFINKIEFHWRINRNKNKIK